MTRHRTPSCLDQTSVDNPPRYIVIISVFGLSYGYGCHGLVQYYISQWTGLLIVVHVHVCTLVYYSSVNSVYATCMYMYPFSQYWMVNNLIMYHSPALSDTFYHPIQEPCHRGNWSNTHTYILSSIYGMFCAVFRYRKSMPNRQQKIWTSSTTDALTSLHWVSFIIILILSSHNT